MENNNDCFVQAASKMSTDELAEHVYDWVPKSLDPIHKILMEGFSKRCQEPIYNMIKEIEEAFEDKKRWYEIAFLYSDSKTMAEVYQHVGQVDGDYAEQKAIDNAVDAEWERKNDRY